jgi:DnaJ domain/Protein of unknown function (DUF1232)
MKLVLSLLALVYFLLPYDLFPDIVLGWGWIDDLVILYFLWRFFYRGKSAIFGQPKGQARSSGNTNGNEASSAANIPSKDPHDVLQISKGASQDEIRTAYKKLVGKYHPDKVLHLGEEFQSLAEERFKEIQDAYQKLVVKGRKNRS